MTLYCLRFGLLQYIWYLQYLYDNDTFQQHPIFTKHFYASGSMVLGTSTYLSFLPLSSRHSRAGDRWLSFIALIFATWQRQRESRSSRDTLAHRRKSKRVHLQLLLSPDPTKALFHWERPKAHDATCWSSPHLKTMKSCRAETFLVWE